jgi:hypothetical protein
MKYKPECGRERRETVGGGVKEGTVKSVLKGVVTPPWERRRWRKSNTVAKEEPIDA